MSGTATWKLRALLRPVEAVPRIAEPGHGAGILVSAESTGSERDRHLEASRSTSSRRGSPPHRRARARCGHPRFSGVHGQRAGPPPGSFVSCFVPQRRSPASPGSGPVRASSFQRSPRAASGTATWKLRVLLRPAEAVSCIAGLGSVAGILVSAESTGSERDRHLEASRSTSSRRGGPPHRRARARCSCDRSDASRWPRCRSVRPGAPAGTPRPLRAPRAGRPS